jgi:AcrR family transcriptional regulator
MVRRRLTAEQRHQQLVAAAITAFSDAGYAGTTTDQVARLAGVSQPYVIRIFRTKQELFVAAVEHAGARVEAKFRAAAQEEATLESMGHAYTEMLEERELITVLLHGFAAGGSDPVIGEAVRTCFGRLYEVVRDLTAVTPEEARDFFGTGMLLTCLTAMRAIGPEAAPPQPWVTEILETFDDEAVSLTGGGGPGSA